MIECDDPIGRAIREIPVPDVEPETGGIGVAIDRDDQGIEAEIDKDIGKPGGWSLTAAGEWWRRKGWRGSGWLKWRGKK